MLITELKSKDDILSLIDGRKTVIISCVGCKELYFPEAEAAELCSELLGSGASSDLITDYICDPENLKLQLQKHMSNVDTADTLLVFSCGVGVQTAADMFPSKSVYAACDTYPLPGHQGVTPLEDECGQCGECHLNTTGSICPITSCSKSLINGQCGGAKNGKCEVDKDMDCGWERIYRRLEKLGHLDDLLHPVKLRNYMNS